MDAEKTVRVLERLIKGERAWLSVVNKKGAQRRIEALEHAIDCVRIVAKGEDE